MTYTRYTTLTLLLVLSVQRKWYPKWKIDPQRFFPCKFDSGGFKCSSIGMTLLHQGSSPLPYVFIDRNLSYTKRHSRQFSGHPISHLLLLFPLGLLRSFYLSMVGYVVSKRPVSFFRSKVRFPLIFSDFPPHGSVTIGVTTSRSHLHPSDQSRNDESHKVSRRRSLSVPSNSVYVLELGKVFGSQSQN